MPDQSAGSPRSRIVRLRSFRSRLIRLEPSSPYSPCPSTASRVPSAAAVRFRYALFAAGSLDSDSSVGGQHYAAAPIRETEIVSEEPAFSEIRIQRSIFQVAPDRYVLTRIASADLPGHQHSAVFEEDHRALGRQLHHAVVAEEKTRKTIGEKTQPGRSVKSGTEAD